VVVEASDYQAVLDELAANNGATTLSLRRKLAQKAYARTAAYDAAISNWFAEQLKIEAPDFRAFGGKLIQALRYGENPHQQASFYKSPERRPGVATARQLQGKELSYNNINDTDAAYEAVSEFDGARRPVLSSSTPIRAASRRERTLQAPIARRSPVIDLCLWRHHRFQPQARCGRGECRRRHFHRSHHRAGRDR
jgi:AICAR transformylase/IMP cyclohydrolase PurH